MDLLTGETVLWKGSPSWRALMLFYIGGTIGALIPVVLWLILNDLMSDPPAAIAALSADDQRTLRDILRRAVEHIPGTPMPGENGNMVLTGHRDTFFRPLRNIRRDDIILLATLLGQFRYRVLSTQVVSPDDLSVLHTSRNEILTLITCYPFYFVGAAPNRFIVRAERMN